MEMLVLDQTRADVGMPAVKVVVPGCATSGRVLPGRLYDVPRQDGLAEKPKTEEEMNPIPIIRLRAGPEFYP